VSDDTPELFSADQNQFFATSLLYDNYEKDPLLEQKRIFLD